MAVLLEDVVLGDHLDTAFDHPLGVRVYGMENPGAAAVLRDHRAGSHGCPV